MSEKSSESLRKSKLSTIGVVALIFSFVAAGAFGIEEAIAASGPGLTLIMLLVFPFVWAFPLCEMVGELGSILPSEGGIYSWGRESFGEFWGWQIGLWSALTTWMCLLCFVIFITICTFPLQTGLKSIKWSYEGFLPETP